MSELKEYIVTLNDRKDLDNFYDDMETPGGALYIPDRAVELVNRRPISRNTHYMLTDEEAEQLRQDPRVLAVEIHIRYTDIKVEPAVSRTSNSWSKEVITTNVSGDLAYDSSKFIDDKNWALLRCVDGQQITNWGDNLSYVDTTSIARPSTTTNVPSQTSTVRINETGKNVDVVIVDGLIDPSHPEYAVNSDGTGGSRVVQYNWFQHNPAVTGNFISTYDYTLTSNAVNTGINGNNNHGAHVAGTVAGSTQGWAVDANIYNIYAYGSVNGMPDTTYTMFDYIREFHKNKAVNPQTGRRNPTITNNSYSFNSTNFASNTTITLISYRGANVAGPYPNTINKLYGIPDYGSTLPTFATALDADIVDAIADGIIVVAAAGNSNYKIDIPGGTDYNNYFKSKYGTIYYHRGGTPNATDGVITVGAVDALSIEYQSYYSNNGPGIDVYAPGTNIISAIDNKYGRFTYSLMLTVTGTANGRSPSITTALDTTSTPYAFKVTKSITGNTAWDSGAYSYYNYAVGMGTAFSTNQTNAAMAIGLRTNITGGFKNPSFLLSDLKYAFYINANAQYQIIESGVVIGSNTAYTTSSIFEIWYYDSTIRYAVDGTVIRTVTDLSSNLSMHLDTSIYTPNSSVKIYSVYPIVVDPRNSNYFLNKINGTSMASPQVAGVLACVLQIYPNFTQADCLRYITTYAKTNQLTDVPNSDWTKRYDLNGAPNRYLYYYKERIDSGDIYPKKNFLPRPTSGSTYPRSKIRR